MTQVAAHTVVVLGTGGTIAGTAMRPEDNLGYTSAQVDVSRLVQAVPALSCFPVLTEQVAQLDSKDMDAATWQKLASRCAHWLARPEVAGIVITHGTDTMEETAFFLQAVLAPAKPVVLTCAMRPTTALFADGPQNLADAVCVARSVGARGVMVVCAGSVHGAADVRKRHTYSLDAFGSGESGPVAKVEEGAVRLLRAWSQEVRPTPLIDMDVLSATPATAWPQVEIVLNHAGATGAVVQALLAQGVDGIVAAGTGNGTLSEPLAQALLQAEAAGVRVMRATRCEQGAVLSSGIGGVRSAGGLSPVKARIALQLELLSERAAR